MNPIYLLPGRGGRLDAGLGAELIRRGFTVTGRELHGEFNALSFEAKIRCIADDLSADFWTDDARIIANSFGAYLLLHAFTLLPPYIGHVRILSPILGESTHPESGTTFRPPRADTLLRLAEEGHYPAPGNARILVGEHDWQADAPRLKRFAALTGIELTVVEGKGHELGEDDVLKAILNDKF